MRPAENCGETLPLFGHMVGPEIQLRAAYRTNNQIIYQAIRD